MLDFTRHSFFITLLFHIKTRFSFSSSDSLKYLFSISDKNDTSFSVLLRKKLSQKKLLAQQYHKSSSILLPKSQKTSRTSFVSLLFQISQKSSPLQKCRVHIFHGRFLRFLCWYLSVGIFLSEFF